MHGAVAATLFCYIILVARGGSILKFALLALATTISSVASFAAAPDPRIGSWTLISAQSTVTPPDKLSVTDVHGVVHVVMSGQTRLDFTAKADGHSTPVPGNPAFDQVELHRIDKKQAEVTETKNGAVVATIREAISKDGNELTVTTMTKGHADQVTVWTRGASPKTPNDPLAGDWTADLSKTRMRQATVLKIDADGSNGVRFTGDYTYTARFDGKPYDVRNSRNDTVLLQLVDAHTVEATFRRDDQATQKDRWVVSGDGKQMTLTSTATLEGGQHMAETLTYRKQ